VNHLSTGEVAGLIDPACDFCNEDHAEKENRRKAGFRSLVGRGLSCGPLQKQRRQTRAISILETKANRFNASRRRPEALARRLGDANQMTSERRPGMSVLERWIALADPGEAYPKESD
jgi:hypothetical protein